MPTIVRQTGAGWPGRGSRCVKRSRLPIGSSPGKNCAASRSLMMTVSAPGAPSRVVKVPSAERRHADHVEESRADRHGRDEPRSLVRRLRRRRFPAAVRRRRAAARLSSWPPPRRRGWRRAWARAARRTRGGLPASRTSTPGSCMRIVIRRLGAKPEVDGVERHEAPDHQSGAGKQHERERQLGDDHACR